MALRFASAVSVFEKAFSKFPVSPFLLSVIVPRGCGFDPLLKIFNVSWDTLEFGRTAHLGPTSVGGVLVNTWQTVLLHPIYVVYT